MVHLGDIPQNLLKIIANAMSSFLLIVLFFILQYLFDLDFLCSCRPGTYGYELIFMALPPFVLTSIVTLIDSFYQKWIVSCGSKCCDNIFSCIVMFMLKYLYLSAVWVSTVLFDGDWYFCLLTNLNSNQTGIPCKKDLTYKETLIKGEYKNQSLVWGLFLICGFFLLWIICEPLKAGCIRPNLSTWCVSKRDLFCPPYYRWVYEDLLSEEVSRHLKEELRKIAKERAIKLCEDYIITIRNDELRNQTTNQDSRGCVYHRLNCSSTDHVSQNAASSSEEFWQRRVLGLSDGVEKMGGVRWDLAGCLLLSWIVCYFCVWKGVKTSGKVVYFTATFPYVMMIVLLIRGLTLPGAADGIRFYLSLDPTCLADPQVWLDAGSQVLYSYAVCTGCLASLGSYNKYNNNCFRDALALCTLNSVTSFIAGFAIFSVLGFMSYELGVDVSTVAELGPGLAFIAYPRAVALRPLPQLWAAFFFIMIILIGLDSQFVYLEGLVTSISDMYPSFFFTGHRRKLLLLVIYAVSFLIGLFMVTEGGLYVFQIFDYYACSGIPFILFAILESICIGWICGADRFYNNIEDMIGFRPSPYMKYCWRFITPCVSIDILLFSLVEFTPLRYNHTYQYPWWTHILWLCLAFSAVAIPPLWFLYSLAVTPGTLRQRLKVLTTPAAPQKKTLKSSAASTELSTVF